MQDEFYMARALKLARLGRFTTHPNPNVGCVIVKNDIIIGEGYHYRAGDPHAEIYALQIAGEKARGATAYVTLEPCNHYGRTPPCCEELVKAGIIRVVIAMQDPNPKVFGQGINYLKNYGVIVDCGLMANEAEQLNKGFLKRIRTGFPYVQLKLGISLDGRTAMANGESKWITSKQSRCDVQYIRAQSHAILTSYVTIINDDPELTVRWHELNKSTQRYYPKKNLRQPLHIIIDNRNQISPYQRIVQKSDEIWIIRICKDKRLWPKNLHNIILPEQDGRLNLTELMLLLGKKQINNLLVEAGATLAGALIQLKLVDELIIYLAPKLLGNDARSLCVLPQLKNLSNALQLTFNEIRQVGPDLCLNLSIM